jgi:hypothetical protein
MAGDAKSTDGATPGEVFWGVAEARVGLSKVKPLIAFIIVVFCTDMIHLP